MAVLPISLHNLSILTRLGTNEIVRSIEAGQNERSINVVVRLHQALDCSRGDLLESL